MSVDQNQRFVELDITGIHSTYGLRVTGPPNANHAPPGWYMIFLIDNAGVPSVAEFVQVK